MGKTPESIIAEAMDKYKPVAVYVGFSGGNDSLSATKWMMDNVPGTVALHCNTGIGIERTRVFVRETCALYGWPLREIYAKEDCKMDYDKIVLKNGFPGPGQHLKMYTQLKERAIRQAVREVKRKRNDRVLIAAGIRHDESLVRAGYAGEEIHRNGAQVWVNPLYWWSKQEFAAYREANGLPKNPIAEALGMSGECLCGAYASPGEKERVRAVDPEIASRIDDLERRCFERGFTWSWEGHPPKGGYNPDQDAMDFPLTQPFCTSCNKIGAIKALALAGKQAD